MPLYRCTYEIDIEVDTEAPEEAARRAYHYMTDPASLPPALQVTERRPGGPALGETLLIDLSDLMSAPEQGAHEPGGPPVTPHELYWAYPESDLLPFAPPGEQESFEAFTARVGDPYRVAGDGLFGFLVSELGDEPATHEDRSECLRRLRRAIGDLETVRSRLAASPWSGTPPHATNRGPDGVELSHKKRWTLPMTKPDLSRRAFFRQAAAAPAAAVAGSRPEPPRTAWLIVELGWEHNDEFAYEQGEYARKKLFYEKEQAEAECRRLCEEFLQSQTPEEFGVDFYGYMWDRAEVPDFDPSAATWDELREAGFPDPYYVLELTA